MCSCCRRDDGSLKKCETRSQRARIVLLISWLRADAHKLLQAGLSDHRRGMRDPREDMMTLESAIRVLQLNERGRQGRQRAKVMKDIRTQEDRDRRQREMGDDEREPDVAAIFIQQCYRGFISRKKTDLMCADLLSGISSMGAHSCSMLLPPKAAPADCAPLDRPILSLHPNMPDLAASSHIVAQAGGGAHLYRDGPTTS